MAEKDEKPDLHVREADDGGAVVHIPEGFDDPADGEKPADTAAETAHDDTSDADTAPEDQDAPTDTDAVREAKRNRRRAKKNLVRETNKQREAQLLALQQANRVMEQELRAIKGRQFQQDLHNLDQRIGDANTRVEYERMRLTQAVEANDAQAIVAAQESLAEAKQAAAQLTGYREQAAQQAQQQTQQRQGPDLAVQRYATQWAKNNGWFDADPKTRDLDSRIARQVDQLLTEEGYDPRSQEYWDEMDSRLRERLPHRYTARASEDNPSPRNTVASSGREVSSINGTSRTTFTLSPDRVRAMKEAGAWDNPERRKRMIQQYMTYDRNHRS